LFDTGNKEKGCWPKLRPEKFLKTAAYKALNMVSADDPHGEIGQKLLIQQY
jgi:hypothetical protein